MSAALEAAERTTLQVVETFWIPVSALVPILAIAFVIEARGIASGWTFERRWIALIQGVLVFVGGVALLVVEARTLTVLLTADFAAWEVVAVLAALVLLFAVVALVPLHQIFTASLSAPVAAIAWFGVTKPVSWLMARRLRATKAEYEALESRILERAVALDRDILEAEGLKKTYAHDLADNPIAAVKHEEADAVLASLYEMREGLKKSMSTLDETRPKFESNEMRLKTLTDRKRFNRIVQEEIDNQVAKIRARRQWIS